MDPDQAPSEPTQDELEWAAAANEFVGDSGSELEEEKGKEGDSNEQTKSEKTPQEIAADEEAAKAKEGDEKQEPGDDPAKEDEGDPTDEAEPTVRDRLAEEAELKQVREATAKDVREKLFNDKPTRLEDADGDPIETVADVMKLQNPQTGKPFTAEEAAGWLLRAQDHFEKQAKADQAEIDKIVEVNVSIKYDLEAVKKEYGEILKALPNLRQKLSDTFAKTLELGADGETIVGTKISMKEFYDVALAPYVRESKRIEAEAAEKAKAAEERKEAAEQQKQEMQKQQKQSRSDRGDVVSTRTKIEDLTDPEEKEWAGVAKEYYEG